MSNVHLVSLKKDDNNDSLSLQQFQRFVMIPHSNPISLHTIQLLKFPRLEFRFTIDITNRKLWMQFESETSNVYKYEVELYRCFLGGSKCKLLFSTTLNYPPSSNHDSMYQFTPQGDWEKLGSSFYCLFSMQINRKDIPFALEKNLAPDPITDCSLLFENNDLTNFLINVENVEFPVHKEILASKSSVFLAMFKNDVKEKQENQMTIEDFKADVIREFLRYLYTNKVDNLDIHCQDLLMLAEKYDVPKLKSICSDTLYKSLTVDNALSILQLADSYNSHELKEETVKFVKHNIKLIIKTDEFKKFPLAMKASLLVEVIEEMH